MIKTVEELKKQAKLKNITRWTYHTCSICGYECSYVINGDNVSYDNYCLCDGGCENPTRSWEDLTEAYNLNQPENNPKISKEYLKKVNETWQFEE